MMTEICILEISDVHGYWYPTDYRKRQQDMPMGLFQLQSLLNQEKANHPHTLLVDNGDFIQGSPLCYYLARMKDYQTFTDIYNRIGIDVGVLGNHEFNYGLNYLENIINGLNYPVLSANILKGNQPFTGDGVAWFEFEGVSLAVIGLTTSNIPIWEKPEYIEGLTFNDAVKTLEERLSKVTKQADVIVVSYHGGFERDLQTGEATEALTGENVGYELLTQFPEIDVLLTGHQHRRIATTMNGTAVIQPGAKGSTYGKVILDYHSETEKVSIRQTTLVDVPESMPEVILSQEDMALKHKVEDWLEERIAYVETSMIVNDPFEARCSPHPFTNLLNLIQMDLSGAEISCTALFDSGNGFEGDVTMRDVIANYPFPNTFNVLALTGQDIKDALEVNATYFEVVDGQLTVAKPFLEPKPQHYNYDIYSGITYHYDISKPIHQRVVELKYQGQPMKMDDTFHVVMNNYRAGGGGGYSMFSADKIIKDIPVEGAQMIIDYFKAHPHLEAPNVTDFQVKYS